MNESILRQHAEHQFAAEIETLAAKDRAERPTGWRLSPPMVVAYILGEEGATPKYFGPRRLVETAVATLVTDRALLLLGVPGTAKTWLSEHLAAAISGTSTLLVQGTAGTDESALRYGWNYAQLIAEGPSERALVPSPVMHAMRNGKIARIEELTRLPSEVQDALITVLSEKTLPIPELSAEVQAVRGFNVIATANDRDRGVNELSSALRRRFNTVVLPLPETLEEEAQIVQTRAASIGKSLGLDKVGVPEPEILRLVTLFRELRHGLTLDRRTKLKTPTGTLSTGEAISVLQHGMALAAHFGEGNVGAAELASGIVGAVIQDPSRDTIPWREYLETVVRVRSEWDDLYRSCRELTP